MAVFGIAIAAASGEASANAPWASSGASSATKALTVGMAVEAVIVMPVVVTIIPFAFAKGTSALLLFALPERCNGIVLPPLGLLSLTLLALYLATLGSFVLFGRLTTGFTG